MGSVRKRGSRIQQRSCPKSPPGAELSQQSGAQGRALGTLCFPLFVSRGPKAMLSPCWFLPAGFSGCCRSGCTAPSLSSGQSTAPGRAEERGGQPKAEHKAMKREREKPEIPNNSQSGWRRRDLA